MKMTKSIITGITAALALSLTSHAEEGKKGKRDKGNHKPSPEERAAMKQKMLERFDTDQDGELSDEEKKTARETLKAENKKIRAAVLAEFDADQDGKLSKDEREGVREWVKENYPNAIFRGPRGEKGKGKGGKKRGPRGNKGADA